MDTERMNPGLGLRGIIKAKPLEEFDPLGPTEKLEEVEKCIMRPFLERLTYDKSKPFFRDVSMGKLESIRESIQQSIQLHQPSEADATDANGNTALHVAASSGNVPAAQELKKFGANLNSKRNDGATPLITATINGKRGMIKWLTSMGSNANAADQHGTTALMIAAFNGNCEILEDLSSQNPEYDAKDNHGRTALMAASQEGHTDAVEFLLKNGADLSVKTSSGKTALFYAGLKGHFKLMKLLVERCPELLESRDIKGRTVLALFAFLGKLEVVKYLCEEMKADINAQDDDGVTPLIAAVEKEHWDVVHYLVKNGAKTGLKTKKGQSILDFALGKNKKDKVKFLIHKCSELLLQEDDDGETILTKACFQGDLDLVKEIVKILPDISGLINHKNNNGRTPLMIATLKGHKEIVEFLIDSNAKVDIQSKHGLNALEMAKVEKHTGIAELLIKAGAQEVPLKSTELMLMASNSGDEEMLRTVIQKGGNVHQCNEDGVSPLMAAAENGNISTVSLLLEKHASVNQKNKAGATAIAYAVNGKSHKVVDLLISHGGDIDGVCNNNETLLYVAAESGNKEAVNELISLGADINCRSTNGKTALMAAAKEGFVNIVNCLLTNGAQTNLTCNEGHSAKHYAFFNNQEMVIKLLEEHETKETVSEVTSNGQYLCIASRRNDLATMRRLFNQGIPVDYPDLANDKRTPLIQASLMGNLGAARLLVECGANVNKPDMEGNCPLIMASHHGHAQVVRFLLEHGANCNLRDKNGRTPLMSGSQNGHAEVVKLLVQEKSILLNIGDKISGNAAIFFATVAGHFDIVSILLENGARVDVTDFDSHTPLVVACIRGFVIMVDLLVQFGANVNFADLQGRTPLMAATQEGHLEVVQHLIENGADMDQVTITGMTAKDYAAVRGHLECKEWLENLGAAGTRREKIIGNTGEMAEMIQKRLLEKKQINKSEDGSSFGEARSGQSKSYKIEEAHKELSDMCTKQTGNKHKMNLLISRGADINFPNEDGDNLLIVASKMNYADHAKWLVDSKADVNCKDGRNDTPLIHAASNNNLDLVRSLVENGANITFKNDLGLDAIAVAKDKGYKDIYDYLKSQSRSKHEEVHEIPPEDSETYSNLHKLDTAKSSSGSSHLKIRHDNLVTDFIYAASRGFVEEVKTALDSGMDVNVRDGSGKTALLSSSESSHHACIEVVNILCQNSADVNMTDFHGNSPLLKSIQAGNVEIAKTLITFKGDIFQVNNYGESPLMECLHRGYFDVLQTAVLARSDRHIITNDIFTELVCEATFDSQSLFFKLLTNLGIDVSVLRLQDDETLLFPCVRQENVHMIHELLNLGVNINHQNARGETCLMIAAFNGSLHIFTCLLKKGADVQIKNWNGNDAFIRAIEAGNYEIAKMILHSSNRNDIYVIEETASGQVQVQESAVCENHGDLNSREMSSEKDRTHVYFHPNSSSIDGIPKEDLVGSLGKQTMLSMYKLFTVTVREDDPPYIQGFSRDYTLPQINVHVKPGDISKAQQYVEQQVVQLNPTMKGVHFAYIERKSSPRYLMDRQFAAKATYEPLKPSAGSAIAQMTDEEILQKMPVTNKAVGSIGCFMKSNDGGKTIYGITSAHTFLSIDTWPAEIQNIPCPLVSEHNCLGTAELPRTCKVANKYSAAVSDLTLVNEPEKTIDVAVFPLHNGLRQSAMYDSQIPGTKNVPQVFLGFDENLLHKKVCKKGYTTGCKRGVVIDVEVTERIEGKWNSGLFVVASEEGEFAQPGDSGSVVVDYENNHVLGMVLATDTGTVKTLSTNDGSPTEGQVTSSSTTTTTGTKPKMETIPSLPDTLSLKTLSTVEKLKAAAKESETGKKTKFFSPEVNEMLLHVEKDAKQLSQSERSVIYSHLAGYLPCTKDTLVKRAKKLVIGQQDDSLKEPISQLKEAISAAMPPLLEKHQAECAAAEQLKQERSQTEKQKEGAGASTESDEDSKDAEKQKRIIAPRKKFEWTPAIRQLLCTVVVIKMEHYETSKNRAQSPEEFLRAFLDAEIKPLWPQGWMQTRMLFKESKSVHGKWTGQQSKPRKPTIPTKNTPTSTTSMSNTKSGQQVSTTPVGVSTGNKLSVMGLSPNVYSSPDLPVSNHQQISGTSGHKKEKSNDVSHRVSSSAEVKTVLDYGDLSFNSTPPSSKSSMSSGLKQKPQLPKVLPNSTGKANTSTNNNKEKQAQVATARPPQEILKNLVTGTALISKSASSGEINTGTQQQSKSKSHQTSHSSGVTTVKTNSQPPTVDSSLQNSASYYQYFQDFASKYNEAVRQQLTGGNVINQSDQISLLKTDVANLKVSKQQQQTPIQSTSVSSTNQKVKQNVSSSSGNIKVSSSTKHNSQQDSSGMSLASAKALVSKLNAATSLSYKTLTPSVTGAKTLSQTDLSTPLRQPTQSGSGSKYVQLVSTKPASPSVVSSVKVTSNEIAHSKIKQQVVKLPNTTKVCVVTTNSDGTTKYHVTNAAAVKTVSKPPQVQQHPPQHQKKSNPAAISQSNKLLGHLQSPRRQPTLNSNNATNSNSSKQSPGVVSLAQIHQQMIRNTSSSPKQPMNVNSPTVSKTNPVVTTAKWSPSQLYSSSAGSVPVAAHSGLGQKQSTGSPLGHLNTSPGSLYGQQQVTSGHRSPHGSPIQASQGFYPGLVGTPSPTSGHPNLGRQFTGFRYPQNRDASQQQQQYRF